MADVETEIDVETTEDVEPEDIAKGLETEELKSEEVDEIIAELERAGIGTAEQLQNKLAVSKEYGQMANLLGDLRRENAELRSMAQQGKTGASSEDFEDDTDFKTMMKRAIREDREEVGRVQRRNQQIIDHSFRKITSHKHYPKVKEIFGEKLGNPENSMLIEAGEITPAEIFSGVVEEFLEGVAKKSLNAVKTLKGKGTVTPPFVESGGKVSEPTPASITETDEKLKKMKAAVDKGTILTEDEELDAIDSILRG